MERIALDFKKDMSELTRWSSRYGIFPGRAFVNWASESQHILLATNTIPLYNFFPKLEGRFPSTNMNFIEAGDEVNSKFDY